MTYKPTTSREFLYVTRDVNSYERDIRSRQYINFPITLSPIFNIKLT